MIGMRGRPPRSSTPLSTSRRRPRGNIEAATRVALGLSMEPIVSRRGCTLELGLRRLLRATLNETGRPSVSRQILFALATSERFERFAHGLPGGEQVAYRLALRYVAGREREDGLSASIDFFGENVTEPSEAERVADSYVSLAATLKDAPAGTFVSLDLSHIGLDEPGVGARRRLARIAEALPAGARIQVGAEQAERADRILESVIAVAGTGAPVSATVQANLKRSRSDASRLAEAGVPIRLVKGAYLEQPAIAHAPGEPTDLAFLELGHELHRGGAELALGTHDPVLREALLRALPSTGVEMLLGVDAAGSATRGRQSPGGVERGGPDLRPIREQLVSLRHAAPRRVMQNLNDQPRSHFVLPLGTTSCAACAVPRGRTSPSGPRRRKRKPMGRGPRGDRAAVLI